MSLFQLNEAVLYRGKVMTVSKVAADGMHAELTDPVDNAVFLSVHALDAMPIAGLSPGAVNTITVNQITAEIKKYTRLVEDLMALEGRKEP